MCPGGGLSTRRLGFHFPSAQLLDVLHKGLVAARPTRAGAGADGVGGLLVFVACQPGGPVGDEAGQGWRGREQGGGVLVVIAQLNGSAG